VAGIRRDLGKVRDDERLASLVSRDRGQRLAHSPAHLATDALVHFVEHERRHGVVPRQHDLERQHESRQLATRGDLGEGTGLETDVQLHLKDDILGALRAGSGERYQPGREPSVPHPERRQQLVDGLCQPVGARRSLGAERGAGAGEVGRRALALSSDLAQIQVRRVEQLELAGGPVPRGQHVGQRRTVLLRQAEQGIAALLHRGEPAGVALDTGAVVARRLRQLLDVGEGPVHHGAPALDRRVELHEAREQLRRARQARRVDRLERLLQLTRQPAQFVGVRETLRLRFERFRLPHPRGGAGDLLHHVAEVVGLALHVVALREQGRFPLLELPQARVRVAHRGPLDGGRGVQVENVALCVRLEQRLRLVLPVQVDQQRAELCQDTHRGGAAIDPGAGSPFPADLPFEHQASVVHFHPQGGEGR